MSGVRVRALGMFLTWNLDMEVKRRIVAVYSHDVVT